MPNYDDEGADIQRPFDFLEENRKEEIKIQVDHDEGRSRGRIIAWDSNLNIHLKTKTGEELIRGSSVHRLKKVDEGSALTQ